VIEVLTKYGEVAELSFDMQFPPAFDSAMYDTVMLARQLAPNTLFRGRGMGGSKGDCDERTMACGMGDYETPEEEFPDKPLPGNWQVIYHGSNYMSYDPVAANYVNGSFIVWHLVDIVSKGGLMQIGYGPDARGQFHPKAVEALEYAGRWLGTNGEAIFASRPMAEHWNDTASTMVRYTQTKDGSTAYAIVLSGFGSAALPADRSLRLADVTPKPGSTITLLGYQVEATRQPLSVQWMQVGDLAVVKIPDDLDQHPSIMAPAMVFKITIH
jgi:alpha-L-fucosidase